MTSTCSTPPSDIGTDRDESGLTAVQAPSRPAVPNGQVAELACVTLRWLSRPSTSTATRLLGYMQGRGSVVEGPLTKWLTLVARHTRQVGAPGPLPQTGSKLAGQSSGDGGCRRPLLPAGPPG